MNFKIVSIQKEKKSSSRIHINKKNAIHGTISYIDNTGLNAMFLYEKDGENYIVPILAKTLSVIGRKYCYCKSKTSLKLTTYVKYIPEETFTQHIFNHFKFKNGQDIYAVVINQKAYVVSK